MCWHKRASTSLPQSVGKILRGKRTLRLYILNVDFSGQCFSLVIDAQGTHSTCMYNNNIIIQCHIVVHYCKQQFPVITGNILGLYKLTFSGPSLLMSTNSIKVSLQIIEKTFMDAPISWCSYVLMCIEQGCVGELDLNRANNHWVYWATVRRTEIWYVQSGFVLTPKVEINKPSVIAEDFPE